MPLPLPNELELPALFDRLRLNWTEERWYSESSSCCCIAGALALDAGVDFGIRPVADAYGISPLFIMGVVEGNDLTELHESDWLMWEPEFMQGYQYGSKGRRIMLARMQESADGEEG